MNTAPSWLRKKKQDEKTLIAIVQALFCEGRKNQDEKILFFVRDGSKRKLDEITLNALV